MESLEAFSRFYDDPCRALRVDQGWLPCRSILSHDCSDRGTGRDLARGGRDGVSPGLHSRAGYWISVHGLASDLVDVD